MTARIDTDILGLNHNVLNEVLLFRLWKNMRSVKVVRVAIKLILSSSARKIKDRSYVSKSETLNLQ